MNDKREGNNKLVMWGFIGTIFICALSMAIFIYVMRH